MPKKVEAPYWLEPGTHVEVCRHCLQPYAYETGRRCEDCDGPVCPACIQGDRIACPDCCK